MIRGAWWAALLTLASARVYDKCELARQLQDYGVDRDQVSTWVCIAFHESQLDTSAQNHGSGDHGIFQISELFWCGPGKACGVPCSAFRDDNIKDDIKCALQIYEEHTRLEGNGFLAWVVYPQHCKQNTKKYLTDCDGLPKSTAAKTYQKTRNIDIYERNATAEGFYEPAIRTLQNNYYSDAQKPSFLAVSDIFQNNFRYDYEKSSRSNNWIDFKIKNVDDLKLPEIGSRENTLPITYRPTTTTTTTTARPIVPWRVIETNQFRNTIPQIEKVSTRTAYNKDFRTTRYDNKSSKLSIYSKPTQPTLYTSPTVSTNYRPTKPTLYTVRSLSTNYKPFPTSYPRTTRALNTQSFQTKRTFNLQTSTLPPFPTRIPFSQKSLRRNSAIAVTPRPTLTTIGTTPKRPSSLPPVSRKQSVRPTQSIFDLYLNPTKRPQLPSFRFNSADSPFKLKIFSGGTTTLAPQWSFRG